MISADLAPFLESGVSILVGTRDANLIPECARGAGARVEPGGTELTVFVPLPLAGRTFENVAHNRRIAACFTRPWDHYAMQLKGEVVEARDVTPAEVVAIDRYRAELARMLAVVGLPARLTMRVAVDPCRAVRFVVESLFVQTPGPGAGDPIATRAREEAR